MCLFPVASTYENLFETDKKLYLIKGTAHVRVKATLLKLLTLIGGGMTLVFPPKSPFEDLVFSAILLQFCTSNYSMDSK